MLDSLPREQLRGAMNNLREHRDFSSMWRRDAFDRDNRIDALLTELAALGPIAVDSSWPEDPLARNLAEIGRFIANATRPKPTRQPKYSNPLCSAPAGNI